MKLPLLSAGLWALLALPGFTTATPSNSTEKRQAQCAQNLAVSLVLDPTIFSTRTDLFCASSHWTDANAIENIHNLMLATGTDQFSSLADNSYLGRAAILQEDLGISLWSDIVDGSYDDASWIILALWKIADYKTARGLDSSAYLNSASTIYSIVESAWDASVCGGGVWWSSAKNYKNSITNELFLLVSATGAINFPSNSAYLTNAINVKNWIASSQLRNSQGLFNDGLTSTCANNGQTIWSYNQGVIASGLGALYAVTRDLTLLDEAEVTLDAAISLMTSGNILKESCDDPVSGSCDNDQVCRLFDAIHLQYYLDRVNDPARTTKYAGFLHAQASGVYHYGTDSSNDIGSVWYAPSQGGSVFTATSSSSGLAAHIANAKYGPCESL
ncbi:glycoside hydrolase family 76 protein [Mycena sanguinolenta]|nr:glycoside hydrolase family 76 protein [Mycena sanguinolenta]